MAKRTRVKRGIFKDANGIFYIRYKHGDIDYERAISKDFRSAELALEEVRQEIRLRKKCGQGFEYAKTLQQAQKPRLFEKAASDYLEERANHKASTLRSYKSILNAYLLPEFAKTPIRDITDSQLRKFQVRLACKGISERKLSPRRVNNIMEVLRLILNQEFRAGHLNRDPAKSVREVPETKQDINPLSSSEVELALANVDAFYRPLFETLAFTGARPNEMLALRWTDIDWNAEKIRISKGRVRGQESLPDEIQSAGYSYVTSCLTSTARPESASCEVNRWPRVYG